jgi:hypothetical protein
MAQGLTGSYLDYVYGAAAISGSRKAGVGSPTATRSKFLPHTSRSYERRAAAPLFAPAARAERKPPYYAISGTRASIT